jgi:hypothetical protein
MMLAIGMIATSAMRVRMAPPFVGRAKAPSSARCWRAPARAYGPRTASGQASSVLASRRRVCGRFGYAQACVVVTPLISSSSRVGGTASGGLSGHENARSESGTRPPLSSYRIIDNPDVRQGPVSDYRAPSARVRRPAIPSAARGSVSPHQGTFHEVGMACSKSRDRPYPECRYHPDPARTRVPARDSRRRMLATLNWAGAGAGLR